MLSHWDIIGLIEALHPSAGPSETESASVLHGHPSSSASSATLQPGNPDVGCNELPSANRSYAGSLSTDGTMVGETLMPTEKSGHYNNPYATLNDEHRPTVTSLDDCASRLGRLLNVCIRLKDLSRARGRSITAPIPQDWVFFGILPTYPGLWLSNGLSQPLSQTSQSSAAEVHALQGEETIEKYTSVRNALLSLLASQEVCSSTGHNSVDLSAVPLADSMQQLIQTRIITAQSQHDFVLAHRWSRTLRLYRELREVKSVDGFSQDIVKDMADGLHASIRNSVRQKEEAEATLRLLDIQKRQQTDLLEWTVRRRALRVKMWYMSDVKNSSFYEEALRVTKALSTMANPKQAKPTTGLAGWARQRLRGTNPYDRADKQALEAMCAPKDHGGVAKLSDEQIQLTSKWLTKNSVENFCKGEERIHRFYYEVHKSLNKLAGVSILESPVLWSSHLFRSEKASFEIRPRRPTFSPPLSSPISPSPRNQNPNVLRSPAIGYASSTLPNVLESRAKGPMEISGGLQITSIPHPFGQNFMNGSPKYPYPSISASQAFGHLSPPMTPLSPRISEVFGASIPNRPEPVSKAKSKFVDELRGDLVGLVMSDLGYLLWTQGSETDIWVQRTASQANDGLFFEKPENGPTSEAANLRTEHEDNCPVHMSRDPQQVLTTEEPNDLKLLGDNRDTSFSYSDAYAKLLQTMSLSQNPNVKLQKLCQLEDLVIGSLQDEGIKLRGDKKATDTSRIVPRTKATRLEEVIANCTERRAGTMKQKQPRSPLPVAFCNYEGCGESAIGANQIVDRLLFVLRDNCLRPATLYRDLQYIAAFVPSATLDQTAQGKAFWDVALAAMALKEDLIDSTIQRASQITNYHITSKKFPQSAEHTDIPTWLASTTLHDAANLWITAAKEGSPVAARELALFYLTHPDLLGRVTAPLSEAKDVFGSTSAHERTSSGALDPLTFSIVLHWMGIAASGGDKEAKDFLHDNGALGFH